MTRYIKKYKTIDDYDANCFCEITVCDSDDAIINAFLNSNKYEITVIENQKEKNKMTENINIKKYEDAANRMHEKDKVKIFKRWWSQLCIATDVKESKMNALEQLIEKYERTDE